LTRYRAVLAYDGERFQGFQRQADGIPTIQGAVESAIRSVTGCSVTAIGAGRTDTGVHATGQVIAFDLSTDEWRHGADALMRAINVALPGDIVFQSLVSLPEGSSFHPRFDAQARIYKYHVVSAAERIPSLHRFAWQVRVPLDANALDAAANLMIGTHDFGAFGKPPHGDNAVRTIFHSYWERAAMPESAGAVSWRYTVEGDAFLYHMVRRLVGYMVDVASGNKSLAQLDRVFRGAQLVSNWTIAPPHALTLVQVKYNSSS